MDDHPAAPSEQAIRRQRFKASRLGAGMMAVAVGLFVNPCHAQGKGRVHALLAIDTDAAVMGAELDAQAMQAVLNRGFGLSKRLDLRVLRGADLRPQSILNYFRTVASGPDDTLFFYYSGHGAVLEGKGQILTTSHGSLSRSALRTAMEARRPRLAVLLTDCCSTVVKLLPQAPGMGTPLPQNEVVPLLRCLLLEHRGTVDVTSSSFGEAAWGDSARGGFFTNALSHGLSSELGFFDADEDGFVTWSEFFAKVRRQTGETYQNFREGWLRDGRVRAEDRAVVAELRVQPDQVPQAFALGDRAGPGVVSDFRAPNLGIRFELVPVAGAAGARLIQAPEAGSGAAQLELEPGDTIVELDGLPIREAVDAMNHHGRTDIVFINVRTGKPQRGVMELPPRTPLPPEVPPERFAANLGIYYQLLPYNGALGARLSRSATTGTPAGGMQLERGDMVVRLDDRPIQSPDDVLGHVGRTSVEFVNIRSGKLQRGIVQLPPTVPR